MKTVSSTYNTIFATDCRMEFRATIGTTVYGMDKIKQCTIENALFNNSGVGVGGCVSQTMTIEINETSDNIPKMSSVLIEYRLYEATNSSNVSEWIPFGTFYIDTREQPNTGNTTLHAYDSMMKTEQVWYNESLQGVTFPISQADALSNICTRIGVTLDSRSVFINDYPIAYFTDDYTIREMLCYIAVANCGNFIITGDNKLLFVPLNQTNTSRDNLELNVTQFTVGTNIEKFSRATLYWDDDSYYTSGDDTGIELVADCLWATQAMTNSFLSSLSTYTYKPYTVSNSVLNPAVELGDWITINNVLYQVCSITWNLSHMWGADISAPSDNEVSHEYPYVSSTQKQFNRVVKLNQKYYGASITRKNGLTVEKTDGDTVYGKAIFNSDILSMQALVDGELKDCIYFDAAARKYKITGDVTVEGATISEAVITNALYSAQGNVSELTVDWIDTSKKVSKYLNNDTTDDYYFTGHEVSLTFMRSVVVLDGTTPQTQQLTNRYGTSMYWKQDISTATITDGIPYINGQRVYMTTDVTAYPVTIYQYTDYVKASFSYEMESGSYEPIISLGYGSGTGNNGKAYIWKSTTGLTIKYIVDADNSTDIVLSDFVDAKMRRIKSVAINKSAGTIAVIMEGKTSAETINYTETGSSMTFTWPDNYVGTISIS